jgi:hypothetical protein
MGGAARSGLIRGLGLTAGIALAVTTLSGCGMLDWGSKFAPSSTPYGPHPSASAISDAPTPTPTPSPSAPLVPATGSMLFYANLVTDKLTGTCSVGESVTIALADHKNDFYTTVDVTVVIDPATLTVTSVSTVTGADGEEGTHNMSFAAAAPVAGTSARLVGTGPTYKVTGTMQDVETRHSKQTMTLIPFTITANCKTKS